jgi:membrane-bound lytic murein transglycosylase B
MANYLKAAGWRRGEPWGREVRIDKAAMDRIDRAVPMRNRGCRAIREMTVARPLADWRKLGVTSVNRQPLPFTGPATSLVRGKARHFLVYANFEAILAYNCSSAYAVSVGLLANRIK